MAENNYSLSDKVFHRLREDILSGKYLVDEELKELTLASELGVSRTPVREALRQLELEGLIEIVPNKGATVIGINQEDIRDICEMRYMLEGWCARKAAEGITEEQIAEADEILDLIDFHCQKRKMEQISILDHRFHYTLYLASGSKMLRKCLTDFHQYVSKVRKVTLSSPERVMHANEEHRRILEAIKMHDGALAEQYANEHIRNTIKNMEDHGLWL